MVEDKMANNIVLAVLFHEDDYSAVIKLLSWFFFPSGCFHSTPLPSDEGKAPGEIQQPVRHLTFCDWCEQVCMCVNTKKV